MAWQDQGLDKWTGTPLGQWLELVPGELDIDAVGVWQIIPALRRSFGRDDVNIEKFARLAISNLLNHGARPVVSSGAPGEYWTEVARYGTTPEEIIDGVIAEWRATRMSATSGSRGQTCLRMIPNRRRCPYSHRDDPLAVPTSRSREIRKQISVTDDERDEKLVELLISLLDHPAESWEKDQVDDMRSEVDCGEYENPFTNLVATGLKSDERFTASQIETLNTLIRLMDLEDSEWVLKLRQWEKNHPPSGTTNK